MQSVTVEMESEMQIVAIDCCEHVLSAIKLSLKTHVRAVTFTNTTILSDLPAEPAGLVVVGLSKFPIRRAYIDWLRHLYHDAPILIFRRAPQLQGDDRAEGIKAEFMLSDRGTPHDLMVVRDIRRHLPLPPCEHSVFGESQDVVRNVMLAIAEHYRDPGFDLSLVAKVLAIPAQKISRVLNQQAGVSFRNLLRTTRIEEAKRLLALSGYSIKEVAALVGFTDSHYFSRSFRELTGVSASEFRRGIFKPEFSALAEKTLAGEHSFKAKKTQRSRHFFFSDH